MDFLQLLQDQKQELLQIDYSGLVQREEEAFFAEPTRLIRVITGVRRSGKSTLAILHLRNSSFGYVNFDDERLAHVRADELNEILSALYRIDPGVNSLFLDEIQNVEDWSLFVNRLYRQGFTLIITGSNSKFLSSELATHLTGRYRSIELMPFSFRELLHARKIEIASPATFDSAMREQALDDYLNTGGFPEIVLGENPKKYAKNLFYSIITRDILYRHKIRQARAFTELATYLVSQFGREISYNRLKNLFSLKSAHTAKNYVGFLEEAYLISTISKFSYKIHESVRYRKSYVIDPAVISAISEDFSANRGFLVENVVYLHLLRKKNQELFELYYFKERSEIDFVIRKDMKVIHLIQVSSNINDEKTLKREINALIEGSGKLQCDDLIVINESVNDTRVYSGKRIVFIRLIDWLLAGQKDKYA